MATNKILLRDSQGNILLPITRSVLSELSTQTKAKFSYLDGETTSHYDNVDDALSYLHDWQDRQDAKLGNLVYAINEQLPEAFSADYIRFDNSEYDDKPDSPLCAYDKNGNPTYTNTVQNAIMALEDSLTYFSEGVSQLIGTAGVSSAKGAGVITVQGTGEVGTNGEQKGDLVISLNVDNSSLVIDPETTYLTVGRVNAQNVQIVKGSGDATMTYTLTSVLDDINTRLDSAPTDENFDNLQGKVTDLEGIATTHTSQIGSIGLVKEQYGGSYAAIYTFTSYDGSQTQINIPKDQFLRSAEYVPTAPEGGNENDYPAIVFNWVLDNDDDTVSPAYATTVIPVYTLVESADLKADTALSYLGVSLDGETQYIDVPVTASTAIAEKNSVEEQIQGLDSALQSVETIANSALKEVNVNGTNVEKRDNIAYIQLDADDLALGTLTSYTSSDDPGPITGNDSISTAISKLVYEQTNIINSITLSYLPGGEIEPITNGFAGIDYE